MSANGTYRRKSDRKLRPRFRCLSCHKTDSGAKRSLCFRQKLRHLNAEIWRRYCSSDPQRRIARDLKISRTTVVRKIRWLSRIKSVEHQKFLKQKKGASEIYLDDLKTYIHTHCKPVSVSVAVTEDRKILGFEVSKTVPNSLRLIEIARKKYGPPKDETAQGFKKLLERISPHVTKKLQVITDEHPLYPGLITKTFPKAKIIRHKSKRAAVAGQGELKEKGHDPLFPINHTFAMIRAHVSRLVRSTWCTSKTIEGLQDHLTLYMHYHNSILT